MPLKQDRERVQVHLMDGWNDDVKVSPLKMFNGVHSLHDAAEVEDTVAEDCASLVEVLLSQKRVPCESELVPEDCEGVQVSLLETCGLCGLQDEKEVVESHRDACPTARQDLQKMGEAADPIAQLIGNFGRWQFMLTFLLSLFNFPCTFHIFSPTFQGPPGDFWCARPSAFRDVDVEQWKNISGRTTIVDGEERYDPCWVKDVNLSDVTALTNSSLTTFRPCDHWEYDLTTGRSIASEWDLVCENAQMINVAEMMFLVGVALGGIFSGYFSDRFGRKIALMISLVLQITLGLVLAVTESLTVYMAGRAVLGFVCVSVVFSGFVLCMELVGGKWLTISGVSYLFPLPFSYIAIAGIAYYLRDWRHLQLAITLSALPFLLLWWVLPESPRWLLATGQTERTVRVLEDAARFNKIKLPSNIDKILKQAAPSDSETGSKSGIIDLFRTPAIRRISLILYVVWFSTYLVYYGLVLNLSKLGGNVYLNSVISGAVEFPAILLSIFILLKLGRRLPLSLSLIGAGISCLLTTPVPGDLQWLTILFAMVGKFCVSSSNVVMPVFTAELFPTVMRNLGVGSSNVPAGVALMLVPYLWNLKDMYGPMPMSVLGVCGILGGLAVLLLPETHDAGLTDTVQQVREKPMETTKA
ncbi:organic cation transporter protein-like isoform X2 [Homalodisca vitripennis]|uniref:organic cation transporter protein-like isoform X2 n=1 Tax=Homalodisca vitripennis TaxID=197043 RepID=UPI001EEB4BBE|nr:organic cation transporter protein-like isoform X2 [Homalodisca vitripennis]